MTHDTEKRDMYLVVHELKHAYLSFSLKGGENILLPMCNVQV